MSAAKKTTHQQRKMVRINYSSCFESTIFISFRFDFDCTIFFLFLVAVQFLCLLRQPQRFSKAAKALEQQHPHHHHLINLQAKGQLVVAVPKLKLWPGVPPSLWEPLWLLPSLEAKAIILLVLKLLLSKPKKQLKRRRQIRTKLHRTS